MHELRMKDLREDADKSQTEIADFLGTSQTQYSRYEREERILPVTLLIKLAAYYSVSTDYLLGLTDIKSPYPTNESKKSVPDVWKNSNSQADHQKP